MLTLTPRNAIQVMRYKQARTASEDLLPENSYFLSLDENKHLTIPEWGANDIEGEDINFGLSGSPTKVKKIENIVFQAKEAKKFTSSDADVDALIGELLASHTIG